MIGRRGFLGLMPAALLANGGRVQRLTPGTRIRIGLNAYGTKKVEIDLPRLRKIIDKVGYRGFAPVEALGPGDPEQVVTAFLTKVRQAFS